MPGRIKDYIAFPKPNGYQSLHTTIFTGDGGIIEVQIRTEAMHEEAELGAASHVGYKSLKSGSQRMDWFEKLTNIFKIEEKKDEKNFDEKNSGDKKTSHL
jgi:(p)ppGpp synthase/HD superfamily hydrolase